MDKKERLQKIFEIMASLPCASSAEEAYELLSDTINGFEDKHSGVPYNPDSWREDGRIYPPQPDSMKFYQGTNIRIYRSKAHRTWVAPNGAIEIRDLSDQICFSKAGSDGRTVNCFLV